MASIVKAVQVSRTVNNVTRLFTNLSVSTASVGPSTSPVHLRRFRPQTLFAYTIPFGSTFAWIPLLRCALIHTSSRRSSLMEFFDEESNWGKKRVQVGRSWRTDELRLKSNQDLHKLWFVLLKERNMLLTMGHAYDEANLPLPSPDRIDKVEESMFNLEQVIRERNRAYHMLETGESGERPVKLVYNALGIRFLYKMRQYSVPQRFNARWHKNHMFGYNGYAVRKFLTLYREKLHNIKRRSKNRDRNRVAVLLRKFPNMDIQALREKYPAVNIDRIRQSRKADGHYVPE